MPNRLTPHLLTELAGLSEVLLESYGVSWGFADEGCWEIDHKFRSIHLTIKINGFNCGISVNFDVATL